MAAGKNLTFRMRRTLSKKLKGFKPEEWFFTKNTSEFIELLNKETAEKKRIMKADFNIRDF
jgi:hypothetical protein